MSENELLDLAFDDANDRMSGAVSALERDLLTIRTGRAHTSLVEHIRVDYYGTTMALNQMATISTPEARLIAIQPWDRNAFDPITKAIQTSDLGINPQSDGILIRLVLPELTEERRRGLGQGGLAESRVGARGNPQCAPPHPRRSTGHAARRRPLAGRRAPRRIATRFVDQPIHR